MKIPQLSRGSILWRVGRPVIRGTARAAFSFEVEQEAELPEPPYVVAANHYSHFDPPAVGAALGLPIRFLALEDLFDVNGLLTWLITGFGAIPLPRHRLPIGALRTALDALDSGEVVAVFPESTRVSHWGTLTPKRGAAWLAKRTGVPLVPVAVIGTGRVFGLDNRLRRAKVRVVVGKPIQPHGDTDALTQHWAAWIGEQVARYPGSEVSGPRRAHFEG
ncbi:MAG: lysophospholipid acyltransferase family protein [Acidimicrobiia bacterium]